MKRCPECRRDYYDDSLLYCLDDGSMLLDGPASFGSGKQSDRGIGEDDARTLVKTGDLDENQIGKTSLHSSGTTAETETLNTSQLPAVHRPPTRFKPHRVIILLSLAGLGAIIAVGYFMVSRQKSAPLPFGKIGISKVTNEGNVDSAAISPDGKYIAYVTIDGGSNILWTKHLATNSRVQLTTASNGSALVVSDFSKDGNYVVYGQQTAETAGWDLYQVPVLGGLAKKLLSGITIPPSLSPDGVSVAFIRGDLNSSESSISIAKSDGSDERVLYRWNPPECAGPSLEWSPDSKRIAFDYTAADGEMTIGMIDTANGAIKLPISRKFNVITRIRWLKEGGAILFSGQSQAAEPNKIWILPDGTLDPKLVTTDLDSYSAYSLGITEDDKTLASVQQQSTSTVYISPAADLHSSRRMSSRIGKHDGTWGLIWDNKGRLFSVSEEGVKSETWLLDPDAPNPRLAMEESVLDSLNVTPDGKYFVFISKRSGAWAIWRADVDGGNFKQMPTGDVVMSPGISISSDGKWILFTSQTGNNVYRTSIDGGEPEVYVKEGPAFSPQTSPDGSLLSYIVWNEQKEPQLKINKVVGQSTSEYKTFPLPKSFSFIYRWAPDGHSIIYSDTVGRVSNLWQLSLETGKAKEITDFTSETIYNFAYSLDGKKLAIARGIYLSDAILISDAK